MHVIVLATQKGGRGKSTLAVGLAIAAVGDGHRVALIDTDPQGTVSNWGRRRTVPEPHIHRVSSGIELERDLLALKRAGFTLAVIDTPPTHNAFSLSAIGASTMCLIPARTSPADIEAALPTLGAVRRLNKPFAFILNQAPTRRLSPQRSRRSAERGRSSGAAVYCTAKRSSGCARRWIWGYGVRSRRACRTRNSWPVAVCLEKNDGGVDCP